MMRSYARGAEAVGAVNSEIFTNPIYIIGLANPAFDRAFYRAVRRGHVDLVGADTLTPRQRGLADSVLACVAAAHIAGLDDLEAQAVSLAKEVENQTAPPITAVGLIKRVSTLGEEIKAKTGVDPLDVPNAGQFASDEVNAYVSGNVVKAGVLAAGRVSGEMVAAGKKALHEIGWWAKWGPWMLVGGGVLIAGGVGYGAYRRVSGR